ncbi:hypothetical protein PNH38_13590 [Anoxybacillus rupiensis]|jgi:hypothetical protein|uniref:Uncharacterized protein n=1 Tax=Anoxybacteroides rupiense TaxID=311460 RepID=A0ABT5W9X2_9BACL|nr:hypothetical protein [Anoxybacillus rupiensis]
MRSSSIVAQEGLYLGLTIETTEHPLLPFPTEEWFHPTDFGSLSPNASDKSRADEAPVSVPAIPSSMIRL